MQSAFSLILAFGSALLVSTSLNAAQLIMVEQQGCHYCAAWKDEIAPAYPKTAEGQFAPLIYRDIKDGAPEGSEFVRRVNFTPTFILMEDKREIGRIEGYPGEDFFWPILSKLLEDKTDFGEVAQE